MYARNKIQDRPIVHRYLYRLDPSPHSPLPFPSLASTSDCVPEAEPSRIGAVVRSSTTLCKGLTANHDGLSPTDMNGPKPVMSMLSSRGLRRVGAILRVACSKP